MMEDITPKELAVLIIRYEMDMPHIEMPHFEPNEDEWYAPDYTIEDLEENLSSEHFGDCVDEPVACTKCMADNALHKAKWILNNIEDS